MSGCHSEAGSEDVDVSGAKLGASGVRDQLAIV